MEPGGSIPLVAVAHPEASGSWALKLSGSSLFCVFLQSMRGCCSLLHDIDVGTSFKHATPVAGVGGRSARTFGTSAGRSMRLHVTGSMLENISQGFGVTHTVIQRNLDELTT